MTNYQRTANWLDACGKKPTPENLSVQIGCTIEEFAELLSCVSSDDALTAGTVRTSIAALDVLGRLLKSGRAMAFVNPEDREGALDALCDIDVTINGIAYFANFDKDGADQAVLEANERKLVDGQPVILPGGKIGKPAGWYAADLSRFV